jgi:hypothetical protein
MSCFLRWCEVAQIDLRSKALVPKVGCSNGRAKEKSLELNRFTLSAMRNASSDAASLQIQTNCSDVGRPFLIRNLMVGFNGNAAATC